MELGGTLQKNPVSAGEEESASTDGPVKQQICINAYPPRGPKGVLQHRGALGQGGISARNSSKSPLQRKQMPSAPTVVLVHWLEPVEYRIESVGAVVSGQGTTAMREYASSLLPCEAACELLITMHTATWTGSRLLFF